jgi:hypothetical protein
MTKTNDEVTELLTWIFDTFKNGNQPRQYIQGSIEGAGGCLTFEMTFKADRAGQPTPTPAGTEPATKL